MNLDAATGKLRWYYQGVPNDFMDHDMQASPISASGNGVSVVLGGGKMGYVYEMNAQTGKLIWKTPVGEHNGHDSDSLLAVPLPAARDEPCRCYPVPVRAGRPQTYPVILLRSAASISRGLRVPPRQLSSRCR